MWPENVVFAKRLSARYVKLKYEDSLFILAGRNQIDLNTLMHFDKSHLDVTNITTTRLVRLG